MDAHCNRLAVRAYHQHTRSDRGSWTGVKPAELQPGDFGFFYRACRLILGTVSEKGVCM